MLVKWLSKAPTAVVVTMIVVFGILALGVLAAFVTLSLQGVDTSDLREWIVTVGVTLILPLLGVNTVASFVGAQSASAAEDQTNGIHAAKDLELARLRAELQRARGHSDK